MTHSSPPGPAPADAEARRAVAPVICYPPETLPQPDLALYAAARRRSRPVAEVIVPPRDARCFRVPAGCFFRIHCDEGSQVGDLNLWHAGDLAERFYSGKTRALHGTHVSTGNRLVVVLPLSAADGDHHPRHARLVRRRPLRRPCARRDRHALRPLHPPAADRRHLPSLLPLQPDPRPGGGDRPPARRRRSDRCTTCSTCSCAPASPPTPASIS